MIIDFVFIYLEWKLWYNCVKDVGKEYVYDVMVDFFLNVEVDVKIVELICKIV